MTVDSNEFIENSFNDGDWTPQQAAQYLEMSMNGDTVEPTDSVETPDNTDADDATEPSVEQEPPADDAAAGTPDDTPEPAPVDDAEKVIMARDGKHTIPYDVLVREREEKQAALDELAAMKAAVQDQTPSNTEKTQHEKQIELAQDAIEQGADASLFGDFTEEDVTKGINELVAQQVEARIKAALEPMHKQQEMSAAEAHMKAIYDAHNDADSIVESREFGEWAAAQPSYAQAAITNVIQQGTAGQIIEMFNNFKQSTTSTAEPAAANNKPFEQSTDELKARAREEIKNTAPTVPTSLSDIPGGHKGATNITEQMESMSASDLVETMMDWSPEKREQYLNNL